MLIRVPQVLSTDEVAQCRRIIVGAEWADGSETAGFQAAQVKKNAQVKAGSEAMREGGKIVKSPGGQERHDATKVGNGGRCLARPSSSSCCWQTPTRLPTLPDPVE